MGRAILIFAPVVLLSACYSAEPRVEAPGISPSGAASKAMELYDANTDGFLDAGELKKCPSLQSSLELLDTDMDKQVSEAEITARLQQHVDDREGLMTVVCIVVNGEEPVEGATVKFVPEEFMGSVIEEASGKTGEDGSAILAIDGEEGCRCGFFRVEITNGSIPEKYNVNSILGQEVSLDAMAHGEIIFDISK